MNLNKILNIDKIYVINLEREKENKQMMIKKLKKYNIQADFVKAVDSKDKNIIEEYKYYKNKHIIPFDVTKSGDLYRSCGAYACLLSHIKVLKDAIKNDYNRICIFQDDIIFHKNFYNELLDKIKKIPKWDILYLGQCGNKKFNPIDYYKCNNSIRGFFAVVLNKNIFIKLYKLLKKKDYPDDSCLLKLPCKKIILSPNLIIDDKSNSSTHNNRIISKDIFYKKYFYDKGNHYNNYDYEFLDKKSYLKRNIVLYKEQLNYI